MEKVTHNYDVCGMNAIGKVFINKVTKCRFVVTGYNETNMGDICTPLHDKRYTLRDEKFNLDLGCSYSFQEFHEKFIPADQQDKYIGKLFTSDEGIIYEVKCKLTGTMECYLCWRVSDEHAFAIAKRTLDEWHERIDDQVKNEEASKVVGQIFKQKITGVTAKINNYIYEGGILIGYDIEYLVPDCEGRKCIFRWLKKDFLDRFYPIYPPEKAPQEPQIVSEHKEEDYTGRYFVKDDLKFKVIGHRNKIVPNDYKYEWPWLIFKQYSISWSIANIRSEDLQSSTETDSNWVPLKKEFVIDKIGFYKARNGRKVFVYYVDKNDPPTNTRRLYWPIRYVVVERVDQHDCKCSIHGACFSDSTCNIDIVGPWEDE